MRRRRLDAGLACLAVVGFASCSGGDPRQDVDEPEGKFAVSADATFPSGQKLAKRSTLAITVRNDENRKAIPNVAVTVNGFDTRIKQAGVADPTRPVFVINGRPKSIGTFPETKEDGPVGGETAYVNTWALGRLGPGKTKTFKWNVTAVRPGPFKISYRVAAGLNGKARAVSVVGDNPVAGEFSGRISDAAPKSRIAEDGKTVIDGTR